MPAPYVYVRDHSVALPGPETGNGRTLRWCPSYDGNGGGPHAWWRIFRVTGFNANRSPIMTGAPLLEGDEDIPTVRIGGYDREEVGYGWPEIATVVPDLDGLGAPVPNGLYAVVVCDTNVPADFSDPNHASWAYFLVRRRTSETKALVVYPFSTLAAYAAGTNLPPLANETAENHWNVYSSIGPRRTRRVSIDRPFKNFAHQGDKEVPCVRFPFELMSFVVLQKGAETVDVCTSFDLDAVPDILDDGGNVVLVLSVGHDEYWSKSMTDKVKAFVAGGKNAAFFSANTAWWQVRFEGDGRIMTCFKTALEDPLLGVDDASLTAHPCDSPTNAEENTLTGVSYRRGILSAAGAPLYTVRKANDPLGYFLGTHVTLANDGLVFFFNGADTSGVVVRFQADGTYTKLREYAPGAFLLWTHVVYVRCGNRSWTDLSPVKEKVLFYDAYTGSVATGYFDANGDLVNEWSSTFGPGWTHITCTYKGDLFFYASTNGLYGWGALNDAGVYTHGGNATGGAGWQQVVPAGHTYLLFYKPGATLNAGLGELHGSLTSVYSPFTTEQGRLLCGVENGLVLSYEPTSGAARVLGFWGGPQPSSPTLERDITLRTYEQTSFSGGWSHIVGIGIL